MQPTATNLDQAISFNEDVGPVALLDIVVTDSDPSETITATLELSSPAAGTLTTSGAATYDPATGVWSVTGSVAEVNAALAAVSVDLATDWEEGFTITTRIRDAADTGPADGTISFSGSGVNDAPVATTPALIEVARNVTTEITGLSFSDVDAAPDEVTVTLAVPQGTLQAVSGGGVTVGGTAASMTLTGTIPDINAFISAASVTYAPVTDATGDVNLTVTIDDGGFNGAGGPLTDTEVVVLEVRGPNTAPILNTGGPPYLADRPEDAGPPVDGSTAGSVLVSSLVGGATSDAEGDPLGVAIHVVNSNVALWYSLDDGTTWIAAPAVSASAALLLDGAARIYVEPDADLTLGHFPVVQYRAWDQTAGVSGGTASTLSVGGSTPFSSTVGSARVNVTAVNDAPGFTGADSVSLVLGELHTITGFGVSDPDVPQDMVATFSVSSGTLEGPAGLGMLVSGSGTSTMTFQGTVSSINGYISGGVLKHVPTGVGDVVLTVTLDDLANGGAGGPLTATKNITLHVSAPDAAGKPPPPLPVEKVIDGVVVTEREYSSPDGRAVREKDIPLIQSDRPDSIGDNQSVQVVLDALDRIMASIPTGKSMNVKALIDPVRPSDLLTALQIGLGQDDEVVTSKALDEYLRRLAEEDAAAFSVVGTTLSSMQDLQGVNAGLVFEGKRTGEGGGPTLVTIDINDLLEATDRAMEIALQNIDVAVVRGKVKLVGGAGDQTVFGDSADQHMVLGEGDDVLHGGGGNDVVGSEAGADTLSGDAGEDTVFGGEGADHLWGGTGADHLHGNLGGDFVHGGTGADTLHGGQGDDAVRGGQGADVALGDLGDDTLFGDLGDDTLFGGVGADLFVASPGLDRIVDFHAAEGDRLRVEAVSSPTLRQEGDDVVVDLGAAGRIVLEGVQLPSLPEGWMLLA